MPSNQAASTAIKTRLNDWAIDCPTPLTRATRKPLAANYANGVRSPAAGHCSTFIMQITFHRRPAIFMYINIIRLRVSTATILLVIIRESAAAAQVAINLMTPWLLNEKCSQFRERRLRNMPLIKCKWIINKRIFFLSGALISKIQMRRRQKKAEYLHDFIIYKKYKYLYMKF